MSTVKGSLVIPWITNNRIFDAASPLNRDSTFDPYIRLREAFQRHGIELNTADVNNTELIAFELHQDVQHSSGNALAYLMLFETPAVRPVNNNEAALAGYRKVFTWNDELVGNGKYVKINFPNLIHVYPEVGFADRERFCCLISSNITLTDQDDRILYPERVRVIRWFEEHAPHDFDLYGVGWDIPVVHRGLVGKLERRFWRMLARHVKLRPFPSYRGKVANKRDVLTRTRFAICYENVRDMSGYITEKIFDCFFSGCVPVYWGACNITDHIPADCFVDRRKYRDTGEVYNFLKAMTELEFKGYQQRIVEFLHSDAAYPFSSEFFAETIVTTIVQDLGYQT